MKVLVLGARPPHGACPHDIDDLKQMELVSNVLNELGFEVEQLLVDLDLAKARREIEEQAPDFVFNLVEGLNGKGGLIHLIPSLLETMSVPYTGSPAHALMICSHKPLAKSIMRLAGLPTPDWMSKSPPSSNSLSGRKAIIKCVHEHGSLFLDGDSIWEAKAGEEILERIRTKAHSAGDECFAEAFVDGREFNVSILDGDRGPELLPISEILFRGYGPQKPRIVCYKAKWDDSSFEYHNTPRRFDFPDRKLVYNILQPLAMRCWEIFSLRGYARVDFRVDEGGNPWILEVNPNPCLSPDAGFMASAKERGLSPKMVVERIIAGSGIWVQRTPGENEPVAAPREIRGKMGEVLWREGVRRADLPWIRDILESNGVFSLEEIHLALEVAREGLYGEESGYYFIQADGENRPIGFACFGPIDCTKGSFDLYWIAVHGQYQNMGLGRELLRRVEEKAYSMGAKRLFIDTSSRPDYKRAHRLYEKAGYRIQGVIGNFYSPGDHKLIFSKELEPSGGFTGEEGLLFP